MAPAVRSTARASHLAGFTVVSPSYLPAGYTPMTRWMVVPEGAGTVASRGYRDSGSHFVVNEWRAGSGDNANYVRNAIVVVTIRGQASPWLPDTSGGDAKKNALMWAENGITYSLITDSLGLQEMTKIAAAILILRIEIEETGVAQSMNAGENGELRLPIGVDE